MQTLHYEHFLSSQKGRRSFSGRNRALTFLFLRPSRKLPRNLPVLRHRFLICLSSFPIVMHSRQFGAHDDTIFSRQQTATNIDLRSIALSVGRQMARPHLGQSATSRSAFLRSFLSSSSSSFLPRSQLEYVEQNRIRMGLETDMDVRAAEGGRDGRTSSSSALFCPLSSDATAFFRS